MGVEVRERKVTYRYLAVALLTLLISTSLAVSAFGGQFEDAAAAYKRGDYGEAYRLIKPLALQGVPEAQYNLALMYAYGQGVPQDYFEAAMWYRRAAEQGLDKAQFNLGLMYYNGQGVPQYYSEALKWYRRAAKQGNAPAQTNLGLMYYNGQGVPQYYVLAHMWFNLAASRFPTSEKENREMAVENRDLVASKMTPDQIIEAQRLAREWKPKKEVK